VIAGKPWWKWDPRGLIDELGISERVRTHLDFIPSGEVEAFFAAADIVALPYTAFEAQSGVGALALPFGRALVVSDAGGLPELTDDAACVVPAGDESALARALSGVLGDEALQARLEAQSLAIAARLGWETIAADTAAIYRSMVPEVADEAVPVPAYEEPAAPAGARQL
jgi:glycosyltransferase involved in cell wall biosynthesis